VTAGCEYDESLGRLADLLPPVTPPAAVWDSLRARLPPQQSAVPSPSVLSIRLADSAGWIDVGGGINVRRLTRDPMSGADVFMVRMAAGATYGAHAHPLDEECLVLEGRVRIDGREYGPGDYELAPRGGVHGLVEAITPLLMYVRGRLPDALAA
jgi:quercetin dioxygenase-like cupin family protein